MAALKNLVPCLAFLLLLSMVSTYSEAREFEVGGKQSWEVPSSPDEFNKWAQKNRFEIGDSIVLKYDSKTDSVLEVTEENYKNCNKSNPIKSFNDGITKITLENSGPYFFISGAEGHCEKGQKLEIRVLSVKHGGDGSQNTAVPAPAPSPVGSYLLAPAPGPSGGVSVVKAELMASFIVIVFVGIIAFI